MVLRKVTRTKEGQDEAVLACFDYVEPRGAWILGIDRLMALGGYRPVRDARWFTDALDRVVGAGLVEMEQIPGPKPRKCKYRRTDIRRQWVLP